MKNNKDIVKVAFCCAFILLLNLTYAQGTNQNNDKKTKDDGNAISQAADNGDKSDTAGKESEAAASIKQSALEVLVSCGNGSGDIKESDICNTLTANKYKKSELLETDEDGYSALYYAIDKNMAQVVKTLLELGADKNQITNLAIKGKDSKKILRASPVLFAAWSGSVGCLNALIASKAKGNIESDFIISEKKNVTSLRLLTPIDAAYYNRKNIKYDDIKTILTNYGVNSRHTHFLIAGNKCKAVTTDSLINDKKSDSGTSKKGKAKK